MTTETSAHRATIRDVAREAGVSISTVSKVINKRHDVGPAVRERVLQTIEQLGYRPSSVARGLRMQRSHTIAMISDDLEGIFTASLMRGVEEAAADADVAVFLCNTYGSASKEQLHLRRLIDKQVDGLIFMSGNRVGPRDAPAAEIPAHVPYLFLYEYSTQLSVPSVLPDDYGGARIAVDHLVSLGSERIAFINGPREWEATQDRLRGFTDGLVAAGMRFDAAHCRSASSWSPEESYSLGLDLLDKSPDIDAIFCASDDLATGVIAALHDRGIAIPREIRVVGFDNRSLAVHQRPPLSSIALPLEQMGRIAGERLLGAIEGKPLEAEMVRVPCELRARESSTGVPG